MELCNRNVLGLVCAALLVLAGPLHAQAPATPAPVATTKVHVDAGKKIGTIKAIHGVNGGPICLGSLVDLSPYHKALGIPLTRIHDVDWPAMDKVNIHGIFPDFKADAESPASYRFAPTDDYLKSIQAVGSGVMYRLGESIEHTPRKYYVHKPADYDQWAKICIGIIRHYNEGWADGLKLDLRYFEIWNEAEIGQPMWDGNSEDYYRLYATAAKAIKARWPKLMVGGPAAAGLGTLQGDRLTPSAHLRGFMDYCRKESLPLDFLSWHIYPDDPAAPVCNTIGLRRVLDEYGFKKTEIHLNEWNYLPSGGFGELFSRDGARMQKICETMGGLHGAAFSACVLLGLQDSPIDMANYYTADNFLMGMFNFYGVPRKTYHAFRAFKILVDHPSRVAVEGSKLGEVNIGAGLSADGRELVIVASNYRSANPQIELTVDNLPWSGPSTFDVLLLDESKNLDSIRKEESADRTIKITQPLPAPGVMLVVVRPK